MGINRAIPGPPAAPLLGHLRPFQQDRLRFLHDCFRQYGATVRLRIVSPTFLINEPEDIHHVLVAREENFRKSWRVVGRFGRRLFSDALLTKTYETHRRPRRLVQPVFHRRVVTIFANAILANIDERLSGWRPGATIDAATEMDALSERAILHALFGAGNESAIANLAAANRVRRAFITHVFETNFPFPHLLPTKRSREHRRAECQQRGIIEQLVLLARQGRLPEDCLLSRLAESTLSEDDGLDDQELFHEAWELLTAGYETTREAMTWSLYLLARHEAQADKVREEVDRAVGNRPLLETDYAGLVYTEMFFSETLRLYPPAWMYVRVALEDDELPSGTRLPAGAKIFLCPYTAHRNERYFPQPERFDPGRFEREARISRPRFAYYPFGGGARVCVAEALAKLEGVMLLASVARQFRLEYLGDREPQAIGSITLRPTGPIPVRIHGAG